METWDVIVVGGGIAGASVAYELADSRSVLVLEKEERPDYHTTGRNASSFSLNYGPMLTRRLAVASQDFMEHPPPVFGEGSLLSPRGYLTYAEAPNVEKLEALMVEAARLGHPLEPITPEDAVALLPPLRTEHIAAATYDPANSDIDLKRLHHGFLKGVEARHSVLRTGVEVLSLKRQRAWEVSTSAGTFQAPIVVNAAGAWADVLARRAGVREIGFRPLRRTAFYFDSRSEHDSAGWPQFKNSIESYYCKPQGNSFFASPSDATLVPPGDAVPDEQALARAIAEIERVTTLKVDRIQRLFGGLRTFARDQAPVVGFDPEAEGFFWLAGQGGAGIKTSPALARMAAGLIQDRALPPDVQALGLSEAEFSPARFVSSR